MYILLIIYIILAVYSLPPKPKPSAALCSGITPNLILSQTSQNGDPEGVRGFTAPEEI